MVTRQQVIVELHVDTCARERLRSSPGIAESETLTQEVTYTSSPTVGVAVQATQARAVHRRDDGRTRIREVHCA